jgi:hypothetical protein
VPPTNTLTGYYAQASADADKAAASLQATVTTTNADLAAAQQTLNTANNTLAADQAANAAVRTALSQAVLPSDASDRVAQLQQNLIKTRIDQAALGAAIDATAAATRAQQEAAAGLATAQQAQQQAAAALSSSKANDVQVGQWTAAVNSTAVTDALTAINDPSVATSLTNAANALEAIIGKGMLVLFQQRRDDFLAAQTALTNKATTALDAQTALLNAKEPLAGAVNQAKADYDADVEKLNDLAVKTVADINSAQAILTGAEGVGTLPDSEQQPLTAATAAASAQVATEKAVFDAKAKLSQDQAALDGNTLTAYQTNPDYDPSADPLNGTIQNDEAALAAAQAALVYGQPAIDAWLVLIPGTVVQLVVGFVETELTVTKYQQVDIAGLLADLTAKESAYAAALAAQHTYQRSGTLIANLLASRQGDATAAAQVMPAREDTAIRGAL